MQLTSGTKLGQYEVVEAIGAGGMGEVYRVRDTKLGRDVAIKVLPEALSRDKERLQRFEREARLLASLNHNNIATLHGLEELEGRQLLVMELVEGETLAELVTKGPVATEEALPLFEQIAEALEAAHAKGIIHRDLKLANIKVTPEGTIKVLDFGLAKALTEDVAAVDISQSPTMTREGTASGVLLGTAPYMSPEQARGKAVDPRTDIWALGCVIFEVLTAKKCFAGETVTDTLAAVVRAEPEWSALPLTTPERVRELLARCLNKDPRQRIQHAGDARIAIEEAIAAPTIPKPTTRTRGWTLYLGAAALVGAAVSWLLTGSSTSSPRAVTRSVIPLDPADELALEVTPSVAISPDGRSIVYAGRRGETTGLYLRRLDALEPELIQGTEGGEMPVFSPDGQWLAFQHAGELKKVPLGGGAPTAIGPRWPTIRGASWSPNGNVIFTLRASGSGLSIVPANGGDPTSLTSLDHESGEKSHRFAEVLPGGDAILFTLGTNDMTTWDEASIGVLDLGTGRRRILIEGGTNPRFSPSGHLVYARGGSLLAVAFDPDSLEVRDVPVTVLEGVTYSPIMGQAEYALSRNGTLVYAPGEAWGDDHRMVWVDRDGGVDPLIETPRAFLSARVSPDGESLAVAIDGANQSVWVYDLSRGMLTRLAAGYNRGNPVWTFGGERVAFFSVQSDRAEIFWQPADSSAEAERLSRGDYSRLTSSSTPDGKSLLFVEYHPVSGRDVWTLSLDGERTETPVLHAEFNEDSPAVAPNGRWMAYESDESGRPEIYVRPFPVQGGKWQVSTGGGTLPRWNPRGGELFYRRGDKLMAVDVRTDPGLELGTPQELFERPSPGGQYDVDRNGERFVMADASLSRKPPTELILVQNWDEELKRLVPVEN